MGNELGREFFLLTIEFGVSEPVVYLIVNVGFMFLMESWLEQVGMFRVIDPALYSASDSAREDLA